MNPFYNIAEFPDFPAMTPAAAEEALPKLLTDAKAAVDALERDAPPSWDGFVCALDDATRPLTLAWSIVSHFMSVLNSEAWRKVHERFQPDLVAFSLRVGQSRRFYELAKKTPAETPVRRRILALRQEMAGLLGFKTYADYSLATKCAPSVAAVQAMEDELAAASKPVKAREDDALAAFAGTKIEPWDIAYWSERQREKLYSYSEEELMQYFNFPDVLKGLFGIAERLFGVTIEERTGDVPVWHPDVRFFRVCEDGRAIAHFYLDPYSRPETKSGGAWMNEFRTRARRPDGTLELPLALIVCNQSRPDAKGRALMRFGEVETIFHEFGHALQHMLTRVDDAGASGINLIEWDAVEVASQFMENWCTDAKTVRSFARHVETGEPIPDALLARVRAAKNYRAANAMLRQLSFGTLDMILHVGGFAGTPDDVKARVFEDLTPGTTVSGDRFLNSFSHIFAGGYAAGYYGYKWSEVMSADCFGAFEEAGLDDEEAVRRVGRRYRDTLLALGGGTDPMEVFRLFRGRAPETKALLRQNDLLPKEN